MKGKKKYVENSDGIYEGVIYRYTLNYSESEENGMSYIGATTNEKIRRQCWKKPGGNYGGARITGAREKYGVDKWDYEVLEKIESENIEDLEKRLKEKETEYIQKFDSVNNGFNASRGGTGNNGIDFSEEHKEKISRNHRSYQSQETKDKISKALKGRTVSKETRKKISVGNKGKKRSEACKKLMSVSRKGQTPLQATAKAKEWVASHKGGYWKYNKLSEEAKANMKAAQQARGRRVKVTYEDCGKIEVFPTLKDCAHEFGVGAGSVSHYISTGKEINKHRARFEEISEDEYNRLK